ncbi:hypothetical protein I8D64_03175 [Brachybacterium sp. MASK1Z-5]|uniref:Uncharacterized protein n=1 Tax=Brachybacterium halotolerans TaxID=2795215 RepID=A0ABS1B8W5_9MICO|nr:hypothetical protein [Brachybacterium halotolerans]MBK0330400.1 hypothetical protein [Brachybacterium halotolerans]
MWCTPRAETMAVRAKEQGAAWSNLDRARAEAEDAATIAHPPIRREDGSSYGSDEHIAYRRGFIAGAEWQASLPPTDVELEDAIEDRLYDAGLVRSSVDPEGDPVATVDAPLVEVVRAVMDALTAARETQR